MSESILLQTALALPVPDIEALIQGQSIVAMPRLFLNPGRKFALYPTDTSIKLLPHEQHYRSSFLPMAKTSLAQLNSDKILIKAWAKCELCQMLNDPESLKALSQLTIWTTELLEQTLVQRPHIFLAHLRVYLLPEPLEMPVHLSSNFVPLPTSLNVNDSSPVLSDTIFAQRRQKLEKLEPPEHPELEELQSAIALLSTTNPTAKKLDVELKMFLGWSSDKPVKLIKPELSWINTIAALGNRSIELEEKKSNYQAGTDFENVTRQSLEFLGFKVENAYKGGAGGLDLFCSKPYPLVGECKAGRLIPSRTAEELIKLGGMHLSRDKFLESTKLVIGPGNSSVDMLKAAQEWKISIINAMTLQKLVELKAKYPGAVNLVELKPYLETGRQIDDRINDYIEKIEREIRLRSQIIQAVKQLCSDSDFPTVVEIKVQYNATFATTDSKLTNESVKDLTIELSSPLTGYLGRIKGESLGSDRFYFLRDLPVDE
ncbi:DUF1802 family protein [Kamptonema animale CS-326]|jgi:hypothetical protein|uniref:DUF1802 family protein n=1 Tax=Kamptonema animale TaxID=92934 RepID=UPI002331103D|nr:DUF1802 family protein [Kamptonema animale]MDB9511020.1 DUF1802 family protein [Kamptonema animale CS-326]